MVDKNSRGELFANHRERRSRGRIWGQGGEKKKTKKALKKGSHYMESEGVNQVDFQGGDYASTRWHLAFTLVKVTKIRKGEETVLG